MSGRHDSQILKQGEAMSKEETVQLVVAGNEIEARGIASHLSSEDMDCVVAPYQDTAYPGIVDRERPWGVVRVAATDLEQAKELLETWKDAEPENLDEAWKRSLQFPTDGEVKKAGWQGTPLVIAALLIVAVLVYLVSVIVD
jgi:hypothetical protein